jgi:hypothetical protein
LGRARMFGARLWARMPPEYLAALKAFAFQSGVPLAEYVRGMVHDHILQRGAAFRERGAALRALINGFYYSWSPWVAEAISASALLRAVFRVLLLPLIGIVHATALIFAAVDAMTGSAEVASVIAFLAAASMSLVVYVALPVLGLAKLKDTIKARQISAPRFKT